MPPKHVSRSRVATMTFICQWIWRYSKGPNFECERCLEMLPASIVQLPPIHLNSLAIASSVKAGPWDNIFDVAHARQIAQQAVKAKSETPVGNAPKAT